MGMSIPCRSASSRAAFDVVPGKPRGHRRSLRVRAAPLCDEAGDSRCPHLAGAGDHADELFRSGLRGYCVAADQARLAAIGSSETQPRGEFRREDRHRGRIRVRCEGYTSEPPHPRTLEPLTLKAVIVNPVVRVAGVLHAERERLRQLERQQ